MLSLERRRRRMKTRLQSLDTELKLFSGTVVDWCRCQLLFGAELRCELYYRDMWHIFWTQWPVQRVQSSIKDESGSLEPGRSPFFTQGRSSKFLLTVHESYPRIIPWCSRCWAMLCNALCGPGGVNSIEEWFIKTRPLREQYPRCDTTISWGSDKNLMTIETWDIWAPSADKLFCRNAPDSEQKW